MSVTSPAAAFSLPPQLFLPQINQATGNFPPSPFMGKGSFINDVTIFLVLFVTLLSNKASVLLSQNL